MSYAKKARAKAKKADADNADPERKTLRNLIRNGKAPRLTSIEDRHGRHILGSFGVVFEVKRQTVKTDRDPSPEETE